MNSLPVSVLGVGFDTARYGHHVTFLRPDLQPACPAFEFPEARAGYDRLQRQFSQLQQSFAGVHFHIRLDAAGQYAENLEQFLRALAIPSTLSVGEPARNNHYRQAIFPKRKADPAESYCAARFALLEQPKATPRAPDGIQYLRELVARLEAQTIHATRLTNQLHNLLARIFPELALLVNDITARFVLTLLEKFPTPADVAKAEPANLAAIPYLTADKAQAIQQAALASVASRTGAGAASLIRHAVTQLRHCLVGEKHLRELLAEAYGQLPDNRLTSIPGIGPGTAAILTAKMVSIDRFHGPAQVVGLFGIFPEQDSSGLDKQGRPKSGQQQHMSRKGNDLVRKYLWNAAKVGIQHNPALKVLYQRLRGRGKRGDVALGHCMRKLLHLVFAVWKTDKPFDETHHDWQGPPRPTDPAAASATKTVGHTQEGPVRPVVTTATTSVPAAAVASKAEAGPAATASSPAPADSHGFIDFAALRAQVSMEQVLAQIGWLSKLRGSGPQRRGPCPLHGQGEKRHHCFSVHLTKKVFHCFHPPCAAKGNVLDLWARLHRLPLYAAAQHLIETLRLETPRKGA